MSRLILFAHGAGLGSHHPWMAGWARRLDAVGRVVTFDYPYMAAGRGPPDRLPTLIESHQEALAYHRRDGETVVLAGKSMGSRVGCHVALDETIEALVCFGYPLIGASKRAPVRNEVLEQLETPILFVQGTRDRLCPLDRLATVRQAMKAPSELHVIETGDHSLRITKTHTRTTGRTQDAEDIDALGSIQGFLEAHA